MIVLDDRLATIASFVRRGSLAADVGCDHAYLSIWLVKNNIARHVIASDINEGPLYRAQKNIAAEGAGDRITLRRCDGLEGIDHFNPDDIIIAGMGGEQIVDIIEAAPFTRTPGKRLILQPMTHPERLRRAIVRMGYIIRDEKLTSDDGWTYQVICAESRGCGDDCRYNPLTPGEFLLGRRIIERGGKLFEKYLARQINIVASRYTAKRNAGYECEDERLLMLELISIQKRLGGKASQT
jgi:tRNA (adenine22-N1)-methyltransferase